MQVFLLVGCFSVFLMPGNGLTSLPYRFGGLLFPRSSGGTPFNRADEASQMPRDRDQ
jgi:hypothetical protein